MITWYCRIHTRGKQSGASNKSINPDVCQKLVQRNQRNPIASVLLKGNPKTYSKYSNFIYIWLMLQNSYIKCIYCLHKYLISQWACIIVKCLRHRLSNINVQYLWKEIDFKLKRYLGMDTNAFSLITTHLILNI